jgi:hypothetical protein
MAQAELEAPTPEEILARRLTLDQLRADRSSARGSLC